MFRIVRDPRGSLVHVRTDAGECIGCIEAGLYEVVKMVITEEVEAAARGFEGSPGAAAATAIVAPETGDDRVSPR